MGKCWRPEGGGSRVGGEDGRDCVGFDGWEDEKWDIICRLGKETAMPRQFTRCVCHFTQSQYKD